MRALQGEIWLTYQNLLDSGVSLDTIKTGVKRKSKIWTAIKDPSDGRVKLIKYATLAESYKVAVRAELCGGLEPGEWLVMQKEQAKQDEGLGRRAALVDKVEAVCEEDYKRYLHLYRGADTSQMKVLSRAAGVIEVLAAWYKGNNIPWKSYEPVKQVATWVEQHQREFFYKKYLPTNPTRLKEKVLAYALEGVKLNEVIALPRSGNDNRATKQKENWWQQIAIELRKSDKNYTQAQIVRKLRDAGPEFGKDAPSETTVRAFLSKNENLTVAFHTDLNNKKRQRHRESAPLAPAMQSNVCWQMDGTKVQFAGHLTGKKTKDGRKETKSLSIVTVRDVYSGAWIGYWYGYGEDENAYRCALKMAIDITGKLPYELMYDQFPGSNSKSWQHLEGTKENPGALEKAGVKLTKTSTASGKASLERGFYTLQQVFEAEKSEFIGLGIKAGIAHARPTELYIARMQREYLNKGWDFEQAWMSHAEVIATYNHTIISSYSKKHKDLHKTPWERYITGNEEGIGRNPEIMEVAELLWNSREEGIRQERIKFSIKGEEYQYYIPAKEYDLLDYQRAGKKVVVRYDPLEMSEIMVFDQSGAFLAPLKEQKLIQLHGPNADYAGLAEFKKERAAVKAVRKERLDAFALTDEVAAIMPTLTGKKVYNEAIEAMENYAMNNVDRWKASVKVPKEPKVTSLSETFDAEAFAREGY
jgi:hypothetical protein